MTNSNEDKKNSESTNGAYGVFQTIDSFGFLEHGRAVESCCVAYFQNINKIRKL